MTDCVHNMVNGGTFYVCTKCGGDFDDLGNPVAPKREPRLRIRTDGTPVGTTVLLDGKDLGDVLYGFSVDFDVSRRPIVTLRCYEIDLELTERHGDPAGNVNFYKACANCEAELSAPPPVVPPAVPCPSGAGHLLEVVTDAKGNRVCACGWDQL